MDLLIDPSYPTINSYRLTYTHSAAHITEFEFVVCVAYITVKGYEPTSAAVDDRHECCT
jgi:hypothetical protein